MENLLVGLATEESRAGSAGCGEDREKRLGDGEGTARFYECAFCGDGLGERHGREVFGDGVGLGEFGGIHNGADVGHDGGTKNDDGAEGVVGAFEDDF